MRIVNSSLSNLSQTNMERLDDFISSSDESTIFHTLDWNLILLNNLESKKEQKRVIFVEESSMIKGVLFFIKINKKILFDYNYSPSTKYETPYGGPIFNGDPKVLAAIFNSLRGHFFGNTIIHTSPLASNLITNFNYREDRAETVIINLKESQENLWNSLKRNTKRNVKKANNNDLEIELIDNLQDSHVEVYLKLVKSTLKGKGVFPQSETFYKDVIKNLSPKKKAMMVFVKNKKKIIGGSIFLFHKKTAYYWHMGFLQEFNKLSPNFFLLWEMILWSKSEGFHNFDFVRIEKDRLPGIARFKQSWGGAIRPYNILSRKGYFNRLVSSNVNK